VLSSSDSEGFIKYRGSAEPSEESFSLGYEEDKPYIKMDGPAVYRYDVSTVPSLIRELVDTTGYSLEDIDLFILHQANERILREIQKRLKISDEQMFLTIGDYGNTEVASLPITYKKAKEEGRIREGNLYVMAGFGAGFQANALLFRE
jgi:3-oxoacyl-[acyl-carrier-protein] synthase-3